MAYSGILFLHILAAIVGLLAGWSALALRKGSRRHLLAGNVFSACMLLMGASGAFMGLVKQQFGNMIGGLLLCYLVATAWWAVRGQPGKTGTVDYGTTAFGVAFVALAFSLGFRVVRNGPFADALPSAPYFIFGSIVLLGVIWDVRMLVHGGLQGAQRMLRHVARMGLALLFATVSLFLGKQQHFPEFFVKAHLHDVPILLVAGTVLYWVIRVRFTNLYKKRLAAASAA